MIKCSLYRMRQKGIGNSTTLAEDAVTYEEAEKVLKNLAESVGIRLKKAGKKSRNAQCGDPVF